MRGHEQGDAHVPPDPTRRSYGHYHNRKPPYLLHRLRWLTNSAGGSKPTSTPLLRFRSKRCRTRRIGVDQPAAGCRRDLRPLRHQPVQLLLQHSSVPGRCWRRAPRIIRDRHGQAQPVARPGKTPAVVVRDRPQPVLQTTSTTNTRTSRGPVRNRRGADRGCLNR